MVTRVAAALLLLVSLLPVVNWIPGGEADASHAARVADWALGTGLCVMAGVLVWFVLRRRLVTTTADRAATPSTASTTSAATAERWQVLLLCVLAMAAYAAIAVGVFSGRPLLIDEIVQVLQARDLAAGQLTHEIPGPKAFFAILHEVDFGARAYGQYPVGGPAMLVLGVLVGATWIVGPLAGAISVWLFWRLLVALEPDASSRFRVGTTLLFAAAPFGAFMFGSHMNHATMLPWLLAAAVSLTQAVKDSVRAPWWGLATGLTLGVAATIRPLDAGAFALPAAAWLAWRARGGTRPFATLALSGVGVAVPLALAFWVNLATTGHPLRFGYDLLWGADMGLGFHASPWGAVHTPQRGVELIALYLTRLNTYLFELPFPSLLLPAIGVWYSRGRGALDRYLLASAALVAVGYWAYWHDGFFLGPRFVFAWLPLLVLYSARGLRGLQRVTASMPAVRAGVIAGLLTGAAYALVSIAAVRMPQYRNGLSSMRLPHDAGQRAGVAGALVMVQESWGAQLIVRLWELGVSRPDAEAIYRNVDACVLEEAIQQLAQERVRGGAALQRLAPLMADSARLVASDLTPDDSQRRLPGLAYTATCAARIEEDRRGYLLYAPWRLVDDGNVYARWLPGREAELRASFPSRPAYLLRRAGTAVDAPLVWTRLQD
ncbi:MAG: hypothetical protein C0503_01330 [Gemmatimonas sp.]|nr:hypothetical protein [Gemmatimonas sp.]